MRLSGLLVSASFLLSAAHAAQPSFDSREVVKQVRGDVRSEPSAASREPFALDDGEFLIDTTDVHVEWCPAVAFDGTNFLVVWEDWRRGQWTSDIFGARVSPAGVVLAPSRIPLSTVDGRQVRPSIAFNGTNFLAVWDDARTGLHDIYGARVSPGGIVLDPWGIAVSSAANGQGCPAVASDGTDFLVVWG